jgi:hypothetical protein
MSAARTAPRCTAPGRTERAGARRSGIHAGRVRVPQPHPHARRSAGAPRANGAPALPLTGCRLPGALPAAAFVLDGTGPAGNETPISALHAARPWPVAVRLPGARCPFSRRRSSTCSTAAHPHRDGSPSRRRNGESAGVHSRTRRNTRTGLRNAPRKPRPRARRGRPVSEHGPDHSRSRWGGSPHVCGRTAHTVADLRRHGRDAEARCDSAAASARHEDEPEAGHGLPQGCRSSRRGCGSAQMAAAVAKAVPWARSSWTRVW